MLIVVDTKCATMLKNIHSSDVGYSLQLSIRCYMTFKVMFTPAICFDYGRIIAILSHIANKYYNNVDRLS